jgi:hypothetical protein
MSGTYIDLSSPPYDEPTVLNAYVTGDCEGVGGHFGAHAIGVGDCIVVDGEAYRITAVKVKCEGSSVYSAGSPPTSTPDHAHVYGDPPVQVHLWLDPMPEEELENCEGYSE